MRAIGLLTAFLVLTFAAIAASAPHHGAADGARIDTASSLAHSLHVGNCDEHGGDGATGTDGHCSVAGGAGLLTQFDSPVSRPLADPPAGYRDDAHADADAEGLKRPPRFG